MRYVFSVDEEGSEISAGFDYGRPARPPVTDVIELLKYVAEVREGGRDFNNLITYFALYSLKWKGEALRALEVELLAEIDFLQACAERHQQPLLYAAAAKLARAHAVHFALISMGRDKRPSLERQLDLLQCAWRLEPAVASWPLALAVLRIHSPQVRDLKVANELLEAAASAIQLSIEDRRALGSLSRDLQMKSGTAQLNIDFDYSGDFWPIQERTLARQKVRSSKKAADQPGLVAALEHLYRLGVQEAVRAQLQIYLAVDDRDGAYAALRNLSQRVRGYSYEQHGRIIDSSAVPFLSETDYRQFYAVWGPRDLKLDPLKLFNFGSKPPYVH